MTIAKVERLQNEMRDLFKKFGITSGTAIVVQADTIHVVEAHVTERNQWITSIVDSLTAALAQTNPDIPIVNYNSAQGN